MGMGAHVRPGTSLKREVQTWPRRAAMQLRAAEVAGLAFAQLGYQLGSNWSRSPDPARWGGVV